jgi:hypothetical protein
VCIHCSTIDDYFVHVCRAHEWECCLNIADSGEFDDDEREEELIYTIDLKEALGYRFMNASTLEGLARDGWWEAIKDDYCR